MPRSWRVVAEEEMSRKRILLRLQREIPGLIPALPPPPSGHSRGAGDRPPPFKEAADATSPALNLPVGYSETVIRVSVPPGDPGFKGEPSPGNSIPETP